MSSSASKNCRGTNGRGADRHRRACAGATSPGSMGCGGPIIPPSATSLPAHLTMFHALPPSSEAEVRSRLARLAQEAPPARVDRRAHGPRRRSRLPRRLAGPRRIRDDLADDLRGLLGAQDCGGWRPHVTIQNKVAPKVARALVAYARTRFRAAPAGDQRAWPAPLSRTDPGRRIASLPVPRALADLADAVAAEIEGGEARFEHGREHRLLHQLVDRALGAFADERPALLPSPRPSRAAS